MMQNHTNWHQIFVIITFLLLVIGTILVVRFARTPVNDRPSKVGSLFLGGLLICTFPFYNFVIISIMDQNKYAVVEPSNIEVNTIPYEKIEIRDEDYQFLVYTILINENSIIGKEQVRVIKEALSDGFISEKDYESIPELNKDGYSDETLSKLKINITEKMAKDLLLEMMKVTTSG